MTIKISSRSEVETVEMAYPKVSICLPNLNTRPYLPERLRSILNQTFQNWEVVIVDSYSEDGAWEYFQEQAHKDPRIRLSQAPRGLYASWNNCIRQSQGEYIYFATSDDTMEPDCLEKMVLALETHPECGLCQCGLEVIDEIGNAFPVSWREFPFGRFARDWLDRPHIRRAPLDGILYCALGTVYTSITQLLIRRAVFDRVGLFDDTWGTVSDFEWGMRAGLLEDCIYIPETLAAWRIHPQQISTGADAAAVRQKMISMISTAFRRTREKSKIDFDHWPVETLLNFYREQFVALGVRRTKYPPLGAIAFLLKEIVCGNRQALMYGLSRKRRYSFQEARQFAALWALFSQLDIPAPEFLTENGCATS